MIQTRAPDVRRLAARILLGQVAITVVFAALCYGIWGARHGASALAGGSIGFIANLFMTLTALRPGGGAGLVLGRVLLGQFVKVALTVAMFVAVARTGKAAWPPVIATYVATLVVFWAVPAMAGPRLPPRSMG
ncbi:MAG: hypothetical protein CMLOHMNK_02635 [Steroidobacteraceae bacterium]|nr:hypothetical protein [Steroidobacteraceae bacterium]